MHTFFIVWFIGAEIPPVGAVLSVVFLFALSELFFPNNPKAYSGGISLNVRSMSTPRLFCQAR